MKLPNPIKFAQALGRLVKASVTGRPLFVTQKVVVKRTVECESRWKTCFHAASGQCLHCSCFVAIKARLATEECPMGHWKKEYFRTVS